MENKQFKYGDLAITCSNCGTTTLFDEESSKNIEHGILITPSSFGGFKLVCSKCGISMTLELIEAENPPKVEEDIEEVKEEVVSNEQTR